MSYKSEFASNNTDLQTILDTINAMEGGSEVESTFTPTDSGGTTYKSKFADNNVDLQKVLELAQSLPEKVTVIPVTITGTGDSTYCYVTINDTTYTEAASGIEVVPNDVIRLYALASNPLKGTAKITIDGVLRSGSSMLIDWTVPEGCLQINIELDYGISSTYGAYITVTTS